MLIDDKLLDTVSAQALPSERLRMNLNFHAAKLGSYTPVLRKLLS